MNLIKNFVDHQECPGINGIYYPDESVQLLNISQTGDRRSNNFEVKLGKRSTILALEQEGLIDCWNDCALFSVKDFPEHKIAIMSGESDYGSDGFVAVVNSENEELIWLVFLDCSNPFSEVLIDEDLNISATSKIGYLWTFPLMSPECLVVRKI